MIVVEVTALYIRKVFVHLKSDTLKRQLENVIKMGFGSVLSHTQSLSSVEV